MAVPLVVLQPLVGLAEEEHFLELYPGETVQNLAQRVIIWGYLRGLELDCLGDGGPVTVGEVFVQGLPQDLGGFVT